MPGRSSIGGSGNEAGSLHRAGVAAYLAAHSLLSRSLAAFEDRSLVPTDIQVEASSAVDDIVADTTSGSRIYIQAKRTLNFGTPLREAVRQFELAIIEEVDPTTDILAIACRDYSGPIDNLRNALRRRRNDRACDQTAKETAAISKLSSLFSRSLSENARDKIMSCLHIIRVRAEDEGDEHFAEASALLDGSLVSNGQGRRAMISLVGDVPRAARDRYNAGHYRWIKLLADAGITIKPDINGFAGSRAAAVQNELQAHRGQLASRLDTLELWALADDLPEVFVDGLLGKYSVQIQRTGKKSEKVDRPTDVEIAARRWGRFAILGDPGTGKSTILQQLAATWARDDRAHFPVLIKLRDVALRTQKQNGSIPLEFVLSDVVAIFDEDKKRAAIEEIVRLLESGEAALFFDGLDECGAEKGKVAQFLVETLQRVSPETPLFVTARRSATTALNRLKIPLVDIAEPTSLPETLSCIVTTAAEVRCEEGERGEWTREREDWVRNLVSDGGLWTTPMFAVLATMLACSADNLDQLPESRSAILSRTIEASLRDWEFKKDQHYSSYYPTRAPLASELLIAFEHCGMLLLNKTTSRSAIHSAISEELIRDSSMGRNEASEIARLCMEYWDHSAGIYLINLGDNSVTFRSKLFAEIAEVNWYCTRGSEADFETWVRSCLSDPDRHTALELASSGDDRVAEIAKERITEGQTTTDEIEAILNLTTASELSSEELRSLIVEMGRAADSAPGSEAGGLRQRLKNRQDTVDGRRMDWYIRIAQTAIPAHLRAERQEVLIRVDGDGGKVLSALACLTDAKSEQRWLTDEDLSEINAALSVELPDAFDESRDVVKSRGRYALVNRGRRPLLSGLDLVAAGVAIQAEAVTEWQLQRIIQVRDTGGSDTYFSIQLALMERGLSKEPLDKSWIEHMTNASTAVQRTDKTWQLALESLAALDDDDAIDSACRDWLMQDLADVCHLMGLDEMEIRRWRRITDDRALLNDLFLQHAIALDISPSRLASQARISIDFNARRSLYHINTPPRPDRDVAILDRKLSELNYGFLVDSAIHAKPAYAEVALNLIRETEDLSMIRALQERMGQADNLNRLDASYIVLQFSSDRPKMAREWLRSADIVLQYSATDYFSRIEHDEGVVAELLLHPDQTIRSLAESASDQKRPPKDRQLCEYWTCWRCGTRNAITVHDCPGCTSGRRPHTYRSVKVDELDF